MATRKHNNNYLFLALACFLGIIAIFIIDGYLGLYDTLAINNGQYTQTIAPDQWSQSERYGGTFTVGLPSNGGAGFTYTIENHRFSRYNKNLDVTLWYNGEKVLNLYSTSMSVPAFGKQDYEWTLYAADIPASYRNSTGIIKIGEYPLDYCMRLNGF